MSTTVALAPHAAPAHNAPAAATRHPMQVAVLTLLLGAALWAGTGSSHAQPSTLTPAPDLATLNYRLKPRAIAPGVWVFEGEVADFSRRNGCNIINTGFIATTAGAWVINTGPSYIYGQQQRRAVQATVAQVMAAAPGQGQPGATTPAQAVQQVLNLNLHPDYFFGNQAWADSAAPTQLPTQPPVPTRALAGSIAGMQAEGPAYADNLYALCGDWMKDTASTPATTAIEPGHFNLGGHRLELRRYHGHTAHDLVLLDHTAGVVFAGGLVFAERIPTTPHADLNAWLASLDELEHTLRDFPLKALVPSHGPVYPDLRGLHQTRDYLRWLDARLHDSALAGLDLSEVLALPLPARFAQWGAASTEYARNATHLYPNHELQALSR